MKVNEDREAAALRRRVSELERALLYAARTLEESTGLTLREKATRVEALRAVARSG